LEKSNPQPRLGRAPNYGFTVILEILSGKKRSFSAISNPRFSRAENEAAIRSLGIKFNYSSELQEVLNQFISKIKLCRLWFFKVATGI
jgi:hypothetical protein